MAWNRPVNHSVHAPVRALVLAGGGARGSYQVGVWRALTELDWRPGIITGTSVGSLNGAMFALDLYETARDMWLTIRSQDVMELPEQNADLSELHAFLRDVVRQGGMDVSPLEEIVERVLDEDALRASPIRLGLVTVEQRGLKARELALDDIPHGKVKDYLLASAACFPALRAHIIDGVSYLDGGYRDNMPTALAQKMGADELGYLRGCAYAVSCDARSCQDAAAFAWQFGQQQKSVREKYPVTLTADLALRLANLKDAELAPLEAAAEDVGVDPTQFYTTETLGKAFLEKCEKDRIESFAPLFEGSGRAADAARAALLPNTFLQALVYRVLTGPVLPEVIEK